MNSQKVAQGATGRALRHRFDGPFYRRMLIGGVRHMPQAVQRATMPLWGGIFHTLVPRARLAVERNLDQVMGPAPPLERWRRSFRVFTHYAQAIANMYALHLGQPLPVEPFFRGHENLRPILDAGRGAIALTAHMGLWQLTPFLMERRDWMPPMTMAMAEEPNRKLGEFERQFRQRFRIVYTTSSPFASVELAAILGRGEFVGMQLDRVMGGAYDWFPFCGKPAPFPLGPATLGRATGAPLVPVFALSDDERKRCHVIVEEPIEVARTRDRRADVRQATARVVATYERYVQRHPEQWFNFYDFWTGGATGLDAGAAR